MFGRSNKHKQHGSQSVSSRKVVAPSVIAEGTYVLGNMVSDGVLDIDGHIEGNVRAHTISLRPNGKIRGDVTAEVLHVYGEIQGLVKAKSVTLYMTARVTGTIMHESLTVDDGALIDGKFKRVEHLFADGASDITPRRLAPPVAAAAAAVSPVSSSSSLDVSFEFDNDNDEPISEAEIKILENLRLIS